MEAGVPGSETIEGDGDSFISIVYERRWPKYAVAWSVRVQRGETDYPLAADVVEAMPTRDTDPEALWAELREQALDRARSAIAARMPAQPERKRGLLARLFGRDSG